MIPKIIALLIIYIFFFFQFNVFIYSNQNDLKEENFENNSINEIINFDSLTFSIFPLDNTINENVIYFSLSNFSYIVSFRFNIIQVKYSIVAYYQNNTLITPSDITLLHDLHLICHIFEINSNLSIDSLAFIHQNKYFKCIEYINIYEKIYFGVLIYKSKNRTLNKTSFMNFSHYFFSSDIFNYNQHYYKIDKLFDPLFIKKQFYLKNKIESVNLKNLYIKPPQCNTKSNIASQFNEWKFLNIFNHYFCFCRGNDCLLHNLINYKNSTQICKYKFYLYLIEENNYLYNKTDYLLFDFPGNFNSFDDAFPVFRKLIASKKNAYYMTINKNILKNINNNAKYYNNIIKGNFINGDFLEKYLTLFLRLKAVISGAEYFSFNNIFYYIKYITFISLTHGLNYFKVDLFNTYYGKLRYNKLVISTSEKIISLAIENGWRENDLIKICLPKWDKLDRIKKKKKRLKKKNKSIFFFFTWRLWQKNISDDVKLKSDYFKNIIELMNNDFLIDSLKENKIDLYFCLHHMLEIYKDRLNFGNINIKFIKQNEIFNRILNSDLLVTDFSSIIFEFIYQNKPFVMFIPDSEDSNISNFYSKNYFNLIKDLKRGSIEFMNKYFNINEVIDKIIYYIHNNFQIEQDLSNFYKSFNLTCGNNTLKFINYLENLA